MAEKFGCRPSEVEFGPARDAEFDRQVWLAYCDVEGRINQAEDSAKKYGDGRKAVLRKLERDAAAERRLKERGRGEAE